MLQKYFSTVEEMYGRVFRGWASIIPVFVVTHPDDLKIVLSSRKHTEKMYHYKFMRYFLGNGLITNSGEKWAVNRQLIQPIFHKNTLEKLLGTLADASKVLVRRLKDSPSQLNIIHLVNQCVKDIINGIQFMNRINVA